jgi:RNA polymerase sigma-70 factor (ECF subfamily)
VSGLKSEEVTRILADLRSGEAAAAGRLLPIIYDELRHIADRLFASRPAPSSTIQPTMLVHDVFMKLARKTDMEWESRAHFFAVAAKAMRDLLVDHARRARAEKRGGGWSRLTLSGVEHDDANDRQIDVIDLEAALRELGRVDERQERIVELRFYAGLTIEEIARVLNVSERTVLYDWRMARAWLRARLEPAGA